MLAATNLRALVLSLLLVGCAGSRSDTFLVNQTALVSHSVVTVVPNLRFEPTRSYPALVIHHVVPGQRIVLGYRWYSPGSLAAIDDEGFEKITIELSPELLSSPGPKAVEFPSRGHLAYTRGGSAWPRSACYGIAKSGSVTLSHITKKGAAVAIQATVEPIRESGDRCDPVELNREFEVQTTAYGNLTPWLGIAGDYPSAETYR
ncbi:MAG: hypothetical protein DWP92_03880 [Armatimonadetes bacterium]|nr:MAG: hypothetical protein DWP92_03880 [Armatimonadota bacterium]